MAKLHLAAFGQGSTTLVFFHGWGFDHRIYLPLIPYLASSYQVILVDLPGFGLSPFMDWEQFKQALIEKIPPKVILIGWSMGGLYATRFALEQPSHVDYLINMASSPYFIKDKSWPGITEETFLEFYNQIKLNPSKKLQEFIRWHVPQRGPHTNLHANPHLRIPAAQTAGPIHYKEGLRMGLETLRTWDLRSSLNNLKQPACFIFGALDPIVPASIFKTMQKNYPHLHYCLIPRSGHIPFLSHTEQTLAELMRHLA